MKKRPVQRKFSWRERAKNIALFFSIFAIGFIDWLVGNEIRLTAVFLIPITLITWRMGSRYGYLATVVSLCIMLSVSYVDRLYGTDRLFFIIDAVSRFISFFVIVFILSNLRNLYLQQKSITIRDTLTRLHNRLGLQEVLSIEIEKSRREQYPFAVIFLDCDNFKAVNDKWGHSVGDQLLQVVAGALIESVRSSDVACRLGGDEFVVYLAHISEVELEHVTLKIKDHLNAAMQSRNWPVTFSIGASFFEFPPDTVDDVLGFTDALMYESKNAGKDGVRFAKWRRTKVAPSHVHGQPK